MVYNGENFLVLWVVKWEMIKGLLFPELYNILDHEEALVTNHF